ncbi:hypothetical protein [Dethiosulfatarculus sandiegensis]|uniref:Uncharacterized protein n=1 Tax=Dethiosulfatarculus sandiegensis TaxID=1429043 RepID=A0A0D2GHP4_9BACT|nr:hypothetical protein [Dethiosulfatarculus sandiegensis]KIX14402.1 hypothetical protein X474_09605 [Dethiosulfatarculus sandiegensis]
MRVTMKITAAFVLVLFPALTGWAMDPSVAALDQMVKGKPPVERQVDIRLDVVGYEVDRNPRAKAQLQAVAKAGGGIFSGAGIKDIKKVMSGVVAGGPKPKAPPSGSRLMYGDSVVRHGRLER